MPVVPLPKFLAIHLFCILYLQILKKMLCTSDCYCYWLLVTVISVSWTFTCTYTCTCTLYLHCQTVTVNVGTVETADCRL